VQVNLKTSAASDRSAPFGNLPPDPHLAGGRVEMHVQPIIDLATSEVVIVESLARLHRQGEPLALAGDFVPSLGADDIDRLLLIALDQSLKSQAEWVRSGFDVTVSVNIDPSSLIDPECMEWVQAALERHAVPASRLILEVLETGPITDPRQKSALDLLRELGVRLALDDLGAGHSTLFRLETIHFDVIKIDRSVTAEMVTTPVDALDALADVARLDRQAGRTTVIEGIETEQMAAAALIMGIPLGQGYWIARPMPANQIPAWIAERAPVPVPPAASYLSVLAFHRARPENTQHDGATETCPISPFLRENAGTTPVEAWHADQHGIAVASTADSSTLLTDWLTRGIQTTTI
jgi:EAL domain-containing protein (putative c-di-GMP-specific phosphodiesterase class I)